MKITGLHGKIPLWAKLAFTAFVAVLVPIYWRAYSPWNFLFFCDVALLFVLVAIWTEDPLLASLPAVGLALPQLLWCLDFLTGARITTMTSYMFNPDRPLFLSRALPVSRLAALPPSLDGLAAGLRSPGSAGLDRDLVRDLACLVLPRSCASSTGRPPRLRGEYQLRPRSELREPQKVMPPLLWLGIMIVGFPLVFYLPTHLALSAWFPGSVHEKRRDALPDNLDSAYTPPMNPSPSGKNSLMIRIISTPPGEAHEEIRQAWVGLCCQWPRDVRSAEVPFVWCPQ